MSLKLTWNISFLPLQSAKSKTYKSNSSKSSKSEASKKFALFEKSGKGKGGKSRTGFDDAWGGAINAASYLEYAPIGSENKSSGPSLNGVKSWTVVAAVIFLGTFLML